MAKKKKGSGGKKKKALSDEEKVLLMEQNALKSAEGATRKLEMASKFLKEKLEQEERNTRINLQKLNTQWRAILRHTKAEEVRKELEVLEQNFSRVLDRKENTIQSYLRDLQEADVQSQMAARAHLRNMDNIIGFQQGVFQQLHADFNKELDELKTEFLTEREEILKKHEKEMADLRDILFAMQLVHNDEDNARTSEYSNKRDDLRTKHLQDRTTLRTMLEARVAQLWSEFQQALRHYEHTTADKRAEFERLRDKDQECSATIASQLRKLQRLNDRITECKAKLAQYQETTERQNKELKQEKESVLTQFQVLKAQMNKSRETAKKDLTELTVSARACLDTLTSKKELAEKVMKQAEMCRKLETEEEKILPFYQDSIKQEELDEIKGESDPAPEAAPAPTATHSMAYTVDNRPVMDEFSALDTFWKRYNKVLLDKLAAEREREKLAEENNQLKAVLKEYLDGISVSEEVINKDNTLFVVNSKTNAPLNVPVGDTRVTGAKRPVVVEAHVTLANTAKMTR